MADWASRLPADPTSWLLEEQDPAPRALALREVCGAPSDDAEVRRAMQAALTSTPLAQILEAQQPEGYWEKPGAGYASKYRGTIWQVIFLDQLGADPADPRVRAACAYVLAHSQTSEGGFGARGTASELPPPPSTAIHCLNGNLLRALIGLGWWGDARLAAAAEWQARIVTGEGAPRYYATAANGPGYACAANDKLPCGWGAVKALRGLAAVPADARTPLVQKAIAQTAGFLLSTDVARAAYPMGWGNTKPSGTWFKPHFPLGYVADVLQTLEALCEAGYAADPRLASGVTWLLAQADAQGRFANRNSYHGKLWVDFDQQGQPSKWVTIRACRVLRAVAAASEQP